jgi:hypothetical protein
MLFSDGGCIRGGHGAQQPLVVAQLGTVLGTLPTESIPLIIRPGTALLPGFHVFSASHLAGAAKSLENKATADGLSNVVVLAIPQLTPCSTGSACKALKAP